MHPAYTDVTYALGQLRPLLDNPSRGSYGSINDRVQRAIDALERVEAELKAPVSKDEEG